MKRELVLIMLVTDRLVGHFSGIETYARGYPEGAGGPAIVVSLLSRSDLLADSESYIYVSEHSLHRVSTITLAGLITAMAETVKLDSGGDGGFAVAARLGYPSFLATDQPGIIYIAEGRASRLQEAAPRQQVRSATIAVR